MRLDGNGRTSPRNAGSGSGVGNIIGAVIKVGNGVVVDGSVWAGGGGVWVGIGSGNDLQLDNPISKAINITGNLI